MRTGRVCTIIILLLTANAGGCAGVGNLYESALIRLSQKTELADIRQDTREELSEQRQEAMRLASDRQLQMARADAERQRLEMEFCEMNRESQRQQLQRQIRESIQSKVAFNVTQGLEVGDLEVDVEELQRLLKDREEAINRDKEALERESQRKAPCGCDLQECGCKPGVQKGCCPRCRHQPCPCQPEPNCGGPEALRQALRAPQRRSLRPAEIPMKLPVRLTFGMENPEVEEARIRREPITDAEQLRAGPCDKGPYQKSDEGAAQRHLAPLPPQPVLQDVE